MIAIKGMEKIPETCSDCDFCHGHICKRTEADIVANPKMDCPLVEIVTCKDCKHYKRIELNSCDEVITFCEKHSDKNCQYTSLDFFCADAERRE